MAEYAAFCTNKARQSEPVQLTSIKSGTLVPLRFNSNNATDYQGTMKDLAKMLANGTIAVLDEIELNGPDSVRLPDLVQKVSGVIEVLRSKVGQS